LASTTGQEPDKAVLRVDWKPIKHVAFDLVGSHFSGQELNIGRGTVNYWKTTPYSLVNASVTYSTDTYGAISVGCSNLTNTFQIVNENGTSNTTYYAIQGRKYTLTYQVTF